KLYTLFLVPPISLALLLLFGFINLIPIIYNLPFLIVVILEVLSIFTISLILVKRRKMLNRSNFHDLIPPIILLFIAWNYGFMGLILVNATLGMLMFFTSIPIFLAFLFTIKKTT
ncbi:MAG: hypothetical protein ACTSU4_10640, partial [Promethearchaeota archaeon]